MDIETDVGANVQRSVDSVPLLRDDVVRRTRLFSLLNKAIELPITTVTAPTGWGKTHLLASWVRSPYCRSSVGWLTVDRRFVDSTGFWSAVMTRIAPVLPPGAVRSAYEDLVFPLFEVLKALDRPFILVLDDVQWLDNSSVEAELTWLLGHLPAQVHVVLSGTYLPQISAGRLRIEGKLQALTAKELAFDLTETAQFFMTSGLDLPAAAIKRLQTRTEGWSAGLRLAALALRDAESIDKFLDEFAGDDTGVADYLTAEVLNRLPEDIHEFLLRTSVRETLTAGLANALTGGADSDEKLRWLAQHNLFVHADARHKGWYRYHDMFVELLRSQLVQRGEPQLASLHCIASAWFLEHGMAVEACRHAFLAENWGDAERLVLDNWLALYLDGQLETIQNLVHRLPERIRDANAELRFVEIATTLALGGGGAVGAVDASLSGAALDAAIATRRVPGRILAASEDSPERHPLAEPPPVNPDATVPGLVVNLERGRLSGDLRAVATAAHGLSVIANKHDDLGVTTANDIRALAMQQLGITEYWVGRRTEAEAHLREALSAARATGRAYVELSCLSQLVGVLTSEHQLTEALDIADEAVRLALSRGWELTGSAADLWRARSWLLCLRGRRDEAEQNLTAASTAVRRQDIAVRTTIHLIDGLMRTVWGDKREALAAIDAAARIADRMPARYLFDDYLVGEQARLALAVGDKARARTVLRAYPANPGGPILLAVAHAELLAREGNINPAIALLEHTVEHGFGLYDELLQAMILQAQLRDHRCPGGQDALDVLAEAVELATPEEYILPFLRFGNQIDRLLRAMRGLGARQMAFVGRVRAELIQMRRTKADLAVDVIGKDLLPDPLTKREFQILRAIAEPGSLPDLAGRLFISPNTLKFHLRGVYRKLGVSGRHEAVIKGRTIGLL